MTIVLAMVIMAMLTKPEAFERFSASCARFRLPLSNN